jgi:hypothetical protein
MLTIIAVAAVATLPLQVGLAETSGASGIATSAQAVQTAVQESLAATSVPRNLNPSLVKLASSSQMQTLIGDFEGTACNPNDFPVQVSAPVPCLFGNPNATKTIVLFGDSNAGNWIPAFATGLATSQYKLAVFMFEGCPTADLNYTSSQLTTAAIATNCVTWHAAVERDIASMKPTAIVAVQSLAMSWKISIPTWVVGMTKFFTNATAGTSSTKRIIMGTSPFFHTAVPACLARARTPLQCAATTPMYQTTLTSRDPAVAAAVHATLIPTNTWFCKGSLCAPVVAGNVVVGDLDHTTIAESTYLSHVATTALLAALR